MHSAFYHIVTYGCQMNVHDSEKIAGQLSMLGYESISDINKADIIVFNTCCIRESAETHAIGNRRGQNHKKRPSACYCSRGGLHDSAKRRGGKFD